MATSIPWAALAGAPASVQGATARAQTSMIFRRRGFITISRSRTKHERRPPVARTPAQVSGGSASRRPVMLRGPRTNLRGWLVLTAVVGALALPATAPGAGAGLAPTPPMGWNSWYTAHCGVTEQDVLRNARALVDTGMAGLGYRYANVDGCWEAGSRDTQGGLQADPIRFPSGMAALGRAIHAMGLRYGIYTSAGPTICNHPQPGSLGHYRRDMRT